MSELLCSLFAAHRQRGYKSRIADLLRATFKTNNVMLASSGRGALHLLLKSISHQRVLIPAYTCSAVTVAARLAKKEGIYIPMKEGSFDVSLHEIEPLLDSNTAFIATHQFGIPCDIQAICELAARRGALVIEDVAAALGTRIDGQLAGSFGDMAFFSFDSTKLVNAPMKSGFAIVKDKSRYDSLLDIQKKETKPVSINRRISSFAAATALVSIENPHIYNLFHYIHFRSKGRYTAENAKVNLQTNPWFVEEMAEWQAYVVFSQLKRLDNLVETRRRLYKLYRTGLQDCRSFLLPPEDIEQEWAPIRFPIRVHGDKYEFYRRAIREAVDFGFSFSSLVCPEGFPNAEALANSVLDLPFYDKLRDAELAKVCQVLRSID